MEYSEIRVYDDVLVSGVEYDFSANLHDQIPRRLYADWASLIIKMAKVVYPPFEAPPLPAVLFFETETIPSDAPYSANADYYMLDYVYYELSSEIGCGLKISYENGRVGGDNPVSIETFGFDRGVSSHIYKNSTSPRANIYIWHNEEQSAEIREIIARHHEGFYGNFRKWKTGKGTLLFEKELKKIPYVDGGIGLEEGERFDDSAEYVETTMSGEVVKRYGSPSPFAIDDEMTVSNIHRVVGGCLYDFHYSQYRSSTEISSTPLLSGLERYDGAIPFSVEKLFN